MRELRRKDRSISEQSAKKILIEGEYGVLSTVDENGQPYGVPLNYVFLDRGIYFHAAQKGYKIDNIVFNNRVSFCVVGKTKVIQEEFTTNYESVICFGKASLVEGKEKEKGLMGLIQKYSPDFQKAGKEEIAGSLKIVAVIRIDIDHMSGKAKS